VVAAAAAAVGKVVMAVLVAVAMGVVVVEGLVGIVVVVVVVEGLVTVAVVALKETTPYAGDRRPDPLVAD